MSVSPSVARWMKDRRGIEGDTLDAWGVTSGEDSKGGKADLVYLYPGGARKFRVGLEKDDRRTWWEFSGTTGQVPYLGPDFERGKEMFLLEGESDALSMWQNAPADIRKGITSISGLNGWKSEYATRLYKDAKHVYVILDNDDSYESPDAAKQNAAAWERIKRDLGQKARRVNLPPGTKDVAEFFMQYDWAAMAVLLKKAAAPVRWYPRLDLTKEAPPTDWLLEGMLVRGEVTVVAGYPGTGKSMLTMALAVAIAQQRPEFLGLPLKSHGHVLYVDEENSADLVLQRLQAMGLTPEESKHIDYLSQAGVALDLEPHKLLEEALDLEPALIVLDSQGTLTPGSKENDADEMVAFFLQSMRPLARETNAAIVLLHHTPHSDKDRPRGSTAIAQTADGVFSMAKAEDKRGNETGHVNVWPTKNRRNFTRLSFRIEGDLEEGELAVVNAYREVDG